MAFEFLFAVNKYKGIKWLTYGINVHISSKFKSSIFNNNIKREINVIVTNYLEEPFNLNLINNDCCLACEDKRTYPVFEDTKFNSERNILILNGNFINNNLHFNKCVINNSSTKDN